MAIHRTRTHFDVDTAKYEHEYIVNNYSKVFRYLRIETPDYVVRSEACKYNFVIEPRRRYILIDAAVEFPALLNDRRCFEVIAECYNEIRTTTAIGVTSSSLPGPSKKIPKSTIINQTSKLISHDENHILYSRAPDEVDPFDSEDYSDDGYVNHRRYVKLRLDLDEISSIKKLRIKIRCAYNRILSNESIDPQPSSSTTDLIASTEKKDLSVLELFHDKVPYDLNIDIGLRSFQTHRNILVLRSDYFKTLFESQFNDCSDNRLRLSDDIDVPAFELLLKYLYSNHLEADSIDEPVLIALFKLSDRFLIETLKRQCLLELMRTHVNKDNVFSYLDFLDTYAGCNELREKCFDLFHKHSQLLKTPPFAQLEKTNPQLALQIYGSFF